MTSQAQNARHKMAAFRAMFFTTSTRPLLTSETERNCCECVCFLFCFVFKIFVPFFNFFIDSTRPVHSL